MMVDSFSVHFFVVSSRAGYAARPRHGTPGNNRRDSPESEQSANVAVNSFGAKRISPTRPPPISKRTRPPPPPPPPLAPNTSPSPPTPPPPPPAPPHSLPTP